MLSTIALVSMTAGIAACGMAILKLPMTIAVTLRLFLLVLLSLHLNAWEMAFAILRHITRWIADTMLETAAS
jgi:hypothetical protein